MYNTMQDGGASSPAFLYFLHFSNKALMSEDCSQRVSPIKKSLQKECKEVGECVEALITIYVFST